VRLPGFEGDPKRHAFTQQVLLADHLAQRPGAQAFGQGLMGGGDGFVLLTHDLDFGAILASSAAAIPSVIQIRSDDLRPDVLGGRIASTLLQLAQALEEGALVTVDPARERVRILPLRSAL